MKRLFWIILFFPLLVQAKATFRFEPAEISLGESAHLILESTKKIKEDPDFSALKAHFFISHKEKGESFRASGGRKNRYDTITLTVFPKQEGDFTTPEIIVNGKPVEPANLTVLPAKIDPTALPITFTAKVNQNAPYVKGLIFYTLTLTDGAFLSDLNIPTPDIPGAKVIPLDLDSSRQGVIDDRPVRVFERTFGIIPEKSGPLTIPPAEFYGTIMPSRQPTRAELYDQGKLFDGFAAQRDIRLETEPVQLNVQPQPSGWVGWWLPATAVSVSAEDSFADSVSVGDSLTRTIILSATGVEGSQLPLITYPPTAGLKIYPSPEQRDTILTPSDEIQGIMTISLVFVPTKNGDITIPAISIPWFNTATGHTEFATLSSKKLHVSGQALMETQIQKNTPKTNTVSTATTPITQTDTPKASPWKIVLFSVLGILIGATFGFLGFYLHHKHKSYRISDTKNRRKAKKKPLPDLYPL